MIFLQTYYIKKYCWHFLIFLIFEAIYFLKSCPIFVGSLLMSIYKIWSISLNISTFEYWIPKFVCAIFFLQDLIKFLSFFVLGRWSSQTRTTAAQWSLFSLKSRDFGLGRQIGQINSGAFGVFSTKLWAPILVQWFPCPYHDSL